MTEQGKPKFTSLANKLGASVTAHGAISTTVATHAQRHNEARRLKRQHLATERALMKDIPPGGIL